MSVTVGKVRGYAVSILAITKSALPTNLINQDNVFKM